MKKTIIAVFSVLSVFSFGLTAGAVNGNNVTNGVGNVVEGAVEGAGDIVGGVVRGAGDVVEGVADGAGNVVEGVTGGTNNTNGSTVNGERNTNEIIADSNIINEQDRLNANTRTDLPNDQTTEAEILREEGRERNPSTGVPIAGFVTISAVALGTLAAVSKKRK